MPRIMSNSESDWELFLNEQLCKPDRVGRRPCDNGADCNRCMEDAIEEQFDNWYAKRIPTLIERLKDRYHFMMQAVVVNHTKPEDYPIHILQHMYANGIVPILNDGGVVHFAVFIE